MYLEVDDVGSDLRHGLDRRTGRVAGWCWCWVLSRFACLGVLLRLSAGVGEPPPEFNQNLREGRSLSKISVERPLSLCTL